MVGSGSATFAVWGYVIAKMKPDKEIGAQVDLNPELIRHVLGEKLEVVEKVVEKLCKPDPRSTTPDKEGRRLIKLGQFSYQVVNGAKYMAIRNEEERRRYNRVAKQRERSRRKPGNVTLAERLREQAARTGDEATTQRIDELTNNLPPGALNGNTEHTDELPHPEENPQAGV